MADLEERFRRSLDDFTAPDLRPDIERRAPHAEQDRYHGTFEPSNRDASRRLAAAVTAFAVFAAAGIFAWGAFDGSDGTGSVLTANPPAPGAVVTLHVVSTNNPSAQLSFAGSTVRAQTGSYAWGDSIRDAYLPLPFHPLMIPSGTVVTIDGHADSVEAAIHTRRWLETVRPLQVSDREAVLGVDPGLYFLRISATYSGDTVPFYFPIDVQPSTEPSTNSAAPLTAARVADATHIGRGTSVTFGEGSVWVGVHPIDGAPRILRIDPETAEVVATIPASVVPSWEVGGGGLLVADGSVWAAGSAGASGGAIVRIDPSTNSVAETIEVPQGSVADVAVNADGIWALIQGNPDEPEVVRIDPSTNQIVAAIPLIGGYGRSIFAGEGWVLAAVTQPPGGVASGGSLVHLDPATNDAGGVFDLGTYPSVAEGDGAVWAVTEAGLVQIDPLSAQPIGGEASVGCTGDALTVGAGGVWCFDPARDRALTRFNPATGEVDVTLGRGAGTGGLALATSPGSVWVIDGADLVRIDLFGPPGAEVVTVPDLIGLSFDEARAQIEAAGLMVGHVQVVTGDYIKEAVVKQDPAPGTSVTAGTTIDLVTGPSGAG